MTAFVHPRSGEQIIVSDRDTFTTPGGVHPPENKFQSLAEPLAIMPIPQQVILPLSQHIGAPAEPVVAVGDRVLTGQLIAEAQGFVSVNIHASISGTVAAIEDRPIPHASGMNAPCIVIDSDGQDQWAELEQCDDYRQLEPSQLVDKIRNAGISGLGGAGFPTAVKLSPRADQPIDTLILNGTECEPYITADDTLMQHYADDIVAGALLLSYLLGEPDTLLIGIEDNKPDAIAAMSKAAANTRIEVVAFPTKYPSGGEKQLIQILTGQEVPSGAIPASLGIVCQNVGTAVAAYRAVRFGEPLVKRITTVVGEALNTQRNIEVRLGTSFNEVLAQHGFNADKASRVVMGGPMMGFAMHSTDVPVVKTTNCILAPSHSELPEPPLAQPCIRCGMCAEACPASLLPQQLFWYAQAQDHEKLLNHNLFDCIECGACSYVCPSNIPLVQYYRASKGEIKAKQVEKEKSDRSRQRFEFRQARIAKAEAEKEAKRLARKKAAEEAKKKLDAEKAAGITATTTTTTSPATQAAPQAAAKAALTPAEEQAKLERALSSAQNRLQKAQQRLDQAEPDKQAKFAAQVKQAEVRVHDAEKKLTSWKAQQQSNAATNATPQAVSASDDPVAAAIERAKAKMALPPKEKLKATLDSLQKRLQKAQEKLATAQADNSDTIEALQTGVDKLQQKISATEQELAELMPADEQKAKTTHTETSGEVDAAQAAIEKAKAKAEAMASMSDADKRQEQRVSLEKRLVKARQRLTKAEADTDDNLEAFRTGVEKLEQKLDALSDE